VSPNAVVVSDATLSGFGKYLALVIDASGLRRSSALVLTQPAKDLVPYIRCIGASTIDQI
jgi:hypothetical protein